MAAVLGAALSAIAWAGCDGPPATTSAPAAEPGLLPPAPVAHAGCGEDGAVVTELFGALAGTIDWRRGALDCEGMPRPDDRGARLRFAGSAGSGSRDLAIIVSLPDLEPGHPAEALPSNVTLIEEGSGRFFSTAGLDSCWTDVTEQAPLDSDRGRYRIRGRLYCIGPLTEVNGDASVTLSELHFTGLLDWNAS